MPWNNLLFILLSLVMMTACENGAQTDKTDNNMTEESSGGIPLNTPSIGVFLDSPVEGLKYQTETFSGITNNLGEYEYFPGERVSFSIGNIDIGSTLAGPVVTPLSLVPGAINASNPIVTNIVRLLLSLDIDKDPANGISISNSIILQPTSVVVDFSVADLEIEPTIQNFLSNNPAITLVDSSAAQTHISQTLGAMSQWGSLHWGQGYWKSSEE